MAQTTEDVVRRILRFFFDPAHADWFGYVFFNRTKTQDEVIEDFVKRMQREFAETRGPTTKVTERGPERESRLQTVLRLAREIGVSVPPEKAEEIAAWKNFSEGAIEFYLRRKKAAQALEAYAQSYNIDLAGQAWSLAVPVAKGEKNVEEIVEEFKSLPSPPSNEDYQRARQTVCDIATAAKYTRDVAGGERGFWQTIDSFARQLTESEGASYDQMLHRVEATLESAVSNFETMKEVG